MARKTSFTNEHTVEYVLTHKLKQTFTDSNYAIIYPHMGREFSNISKYIHTKDHFKMIGFFARRPKLNESLDTIDIKINQEIIDRSKLGYDKYNIPFFVGFPVANNFWNLNENIVWLETNELKGETVISFDSNTKKLIYPQEIRMTCNLDNFHSTIIHTNNRFDLSAAETAIRDINIGHTAYNALFVYGRTYKPFYLLIKTDN